jgi:predicted Zn-dependent protease
MGGFRPAISSRAKEAVREFQRALERAPKRAVCLRDLAQAEAASGDTASSQETLAELKTF